MISYLMATAYLTMQDQVEEGKVTSTLNRLDTLRKALSTWVTDNQRPYPKYDVQPLVGRYIAKSEVDAYGQDFIVDPYFLRVLSRGKDGLIGTAVPFLGEELEERIWTENLIAPTESVSLDDMVVEATTMGRIVITGPGGGLWTIRPDGTDLVSVTGQGTYGDIGPGGTGILVYESGAAGVPLRHWTDERGREGEFDPAGLRDGNGDPVLDSEGNPIGKDSEAEAMTWVSTAPLGNGTVDFSGATFGSMAIAPDGIRFGFLVDTGGTQYLGVGDLAAPLEDEANSTFVVTQFPGAGDGVLLDGTSTPLSWDREGRFLYTTVSHSSGARVHRYASSPNSYSTTPSWGKIASDNVQYADFGRSTDRIAYLRNNTTMVLSLGAPPSYADVAGSGGDLLAPTPATGAVPSGSDQRLALSPRGDAIAVLGTDDNLYVWWPDRSDKNRLRIFAGVAAELGGAVESIHWR